MHLCYVQSDFTYDFILHFQLFITLDTTSHESRLLLHSYWLNVHYGIS